MNLQIFVMPVLALAAGLVSLFTSTEKLKRRWVLAVLLGSLFSTFGFEIYFKADAQRVNTSEREWNRARITDLTQALAAFRKEAVGELSSIRDQLRSFGWKSESIPPIQVVEQSLQAESQRTQLASATAAPKRAETTVQYFPKDVDRTVVEAALRELGFHLITGPTQVQDIPTNSIWFGAAVPLDDAKLVAYTLIRAGVQIKAIRLFRNPTGNRARLIQVGADTAYEGKPALTVAEIRDASEFSR